MPERSLRSDLRAVSIVWRREMIRFRRDRLRAVTSLIQPLLFLLVLGTGLSSLARGSFPSGVNFKTFIFPGVLAMSVLFTAVFSAASIVWDREFGFMREMLVAPVSRSAIVIGKCLGGATIATVQGVIMLALAGLAGVPYNALLFLTLIGELLLLSFTITAFGVMMAARITQFQAFMALTQMLVMPLFFLSGALYPLAGLPGWLSVLTRIDPLTYVVGPDAARGVLAPEHQPAVPVASVTRDHLGGLGGADLAVAGDCAGDGAGHAGHGHRRVQQDRVGLGRGGAPRWRRTCAAGPASNSRSKSLSPLQVASRAGARAVQPLAPAAHRQGRLKATECRAPARGARLGGGGAAPRGNTASLRRRRPSRQA